MKVAMWRLIAAAFLAGGLLGTAAATLGDPLPVQATSKSIDARIKSGEGHRDVDLVALKVTFRRPSNVPFPPDNAFSEQKRALGEALFHDKRLSVDGSLACASCHDRDKGFADGKVQGRGVPGRPLKRHTPTLWNLAWASPVFWDGRARSLEEQVAGPIESPDEMAQPLASVVARLAVDPAMVRAFADAFPEAPGVNASILAKAIATYERTFVSPTTRFDRWIAGDEQALKENEIAGFRLFTGKAHCVTATAALPSPITPSTISACRATTAAAGRCCVSNRSTTPSRRRDCASSAVPPPTCTTARSPRSPACSTTT